MLVSLRCTHCGAKLSVDSQLEKIREQDRSCWTTALEEFGNFLSIAAKSAKPAFPRRLIGRCFVDQVDSSGLERPVGQTLIQLFPKFRSLAEITDGCLTSGP